MTDRLKGFTITLEKDVRDDDADGIINALKMVKGVASVKPLTKNSVDDMARTRVFGEMREKFLQFYDDNFRNI